MNGRSFETELSKGHRHYFSGLAYQLFTSCLSEYFLYVVTTKGQSSVIAVSACRHASGSNMVTFTFQPLHLFPTYVPSVVTFSSIIRYAYDHTLLKVIPLKSDWLRAADELNADLVI